MIFTFKLNTNNVSTTTNIIKNFLKEKNIDISYADVCVLAYRINEKSYAYVDSIQASSEEKAWEKVDINDNLNDYLEITEIDDSDEIEAEERARARYEAMQEDLAVERYHEEKYG